MRRTTLERDQCAALDRPAQPPRTRELLLDGVMSLVADLGADEIQFVMSNRDREMWTAVRSRCDLASTRPIGMTCLVRATVRTSTPRTERVQKASADADSRVTVTVRALPTPYVADTVTSR